MRRPLLKSRQRAGRSSAKKQRYRRQHSRQGQKERQGGGGRPKRSASNFLYPQAHPAEEDESAETQLYAHCNPHAAQPIGVYEQGSQR